MRLLLVSLAALVAFGQLTKLQRLENYLEKYLAAEEEDSVAAIVPDMTKLGQLARLFTQDESKGREKSREALDRYGIAVRDMMDFDNNGDGALTADEISPVFTNYDDWGDETGENTEGIKKTIAFMTDTTYVPPGPVACTAENYCNSRGSTSGFLVSGCSSCESCTGGYSGNQCDREPYMTKLDQLALLFTQDESKGREKSREALKRYGIAVRDVMDFDNNEDGKLNASEISPVFINHDTWGLETGADTEGIDKTIAFMTKEPKSKAEQLAQLFTEDNLRETIKKRENLFKEKQNYNKGQKRLLPRLETLIESLLENPRRL